MLLAILIGLAVLLALVFATCPRARAWLAGVVRDLITRILCGTTCKYCEFGRSCDMDWRE